MRRLPRHSILLLLLVALPVTGQLAYVESSSGLAERGLESGRTEFTFGDGAGQRELVATIPTRPAAARITAAPNPFNPRTSFHLTVPGSAQATVTIHDVRGRLVTAAGVLATTSVALVR